jgi:SAM-dependent methyltransferase
MSDFQDMAAIEGFAEAYETRSVPYLFAPLADDLLPLLDVDGLVVDLCCGTGAVTRRLPQGVGFDLSMEMLRVAPAAVARANVMVLPLPDGCAAAVVCQQGMQFVPEPERAFDEVHRVLAGGGRFVVSTWAPVADNPLQTAQVDGTAAVGWGEPGFPPLAFGFGADRLRSLAEGAGFAVASCERRSPVTRFETMDDAVTFAATPPAVRARIREATREEVAAFGAAVAESLSPYLLDDGAVEVPLRTDVLVASLSTSGA